MKFYGGAELVIVKLLNYLTERGIKNALLTLNISPAVKKELKGTEIILPKESFWTRPNVPYSLTIAPMVSIFSKYLKKNIDRFDVINVHNFPAELVAPFSNKKIVWMCNEPPQLNFAGPSAIERAIGDAIVKVDKFVVKKHVDCVCVADDFNAGRFEKIYGVKPIVNPYGVDCEFFTNGNARRARKKFKIRDGDFVLTQVGMITPFKNQLESVEVAAKLKGEIPNLKLVLAGTGEKDYEKGLKKEVQKSGLRDRVIFTGHVPRADVRDIYAATDIAIFPVKLQGGWLSPFEALCSETPIVVSKQMTANEMIGKNGIGVVTDDFVGAVLEIRKNPDKFKKMARRGHKWVGENLTWDKFCEKMLSCFEDC